MGACNNKMSEEVCAEKYRGYSTPVEVEKIQVRNRGVCALEKKNITDSYQGWVSPRVAADKQREFEKSMRDSYFQKRDELETRYKGFIPQSRLVQGLAKERATQKAACGAEKDEVRRIARADEKRKCSNDAANARSEATRWRAKWRGADKLIRNHTNELAAERKKTKDAIKYCTDNFVSKQEAAGMVANAKSDCARDMNNHLPLADHNRRMSAAAATCQKRLDDQRKTNSCENDTRFITKLDCSTRRADEVAKTKTTYANHIPRSACDVEVGQVNTNLRSAQNTIRARDKSIADLTKSHKTKLDGMRTVAQLEAAKTQGKKEMQAAYDALLKRHNDATAKCDAIKNKEKSQKCTEESAAPGYEVDSHCMMHSFGHCVIKDGCVTVDACGRGYHPADLGGGCVCEEDKLGSSLHGPYGSGSSSSKAMMDGLRDKLLRKDRDTDGYRAVLKAQASGAGHGNGKACVAPFSGNKKWCGSFTSVSGTPSKVSMC